MHLRDRGASGDCWFNGGGAGSSTNDGIDRDGCHASGSVITISSSHNIDNGSWFCSGRPTSGQSDTGSRGADIAFRANKRYPSAFATWPSAAPADADHRHADANPVSCRRPGDSNRDGGRCSKTPEYSDHGFGPILLWN